MRRLTLLLGLSLGLVGTATAGVYAIRVTRDDGCPSRESLAVPRTEFRQERYYTVVTLRNENRCYGFDDEAVDITLFGPHHRRAISYWEYAGGRGPVHGDVGICCRVTLPPGGTWRIRLGSPKASQGSESIRVCNVQVRMMRDAGLGVWTRMPPSSATITGRGVFPPGWKSTAKPLPDDPTWREPCETMPPS